MADSFSNCSAVGISSIPEGMAYNDSVGALKANVAPLRSVIIPRDAGSGSVRTKRWSP